MTGQHILDQVLSIKDPENMLPSDAFWEYRIQDGFKISILDFRPVHTLSLAYEKEQTTLNFGFVQAGSFTKQVCSPVQDKRTVMNHAGAGGIAYLPCQKGRLIIPGQPRVRLVHVHLSPAVFYALFHGDRDSLPPDLKPVLEGADHRCRILETGVPAIAGSALERLISGPPPGTPARLFYQGLALDLMAGQVALINTGTRTRTGLGTDDRDRVIHARDLLVQDLDAPPCLNQLARMAGLNVNKLQKGFRMLYGVSVFQYLQAYRMKQANRFFHETDMNVSQAASAVGYANVSHFSRAYKKHFNILPKKHAACIRQ